MQALLLGKNDDQLETVASVLRGHGNAVHLLDSLKRAWQLLSKDQPTIIIITHLTQEYLSFCSRVKKMQPDLTLAIVAIQDSMSKSEWQSAMEAGLDEIVIKQKSLEDFEAQIAFVEKWAEEKLKSIEAEHNLKDLDERFAHALEDSPLMLFNQDEELRYNWVYNLPPGLTPQKILGKTDWELLSEKDSGYITQIKQNVLESGEPMRQEIPLTFNNEGYTYDVHILPLTKKKGKISGITISAVDITKYKRTEDALRESERRFRSFFDHAPIGMAIISPRGRLLEVNHALSEILGYSESELLKMSLRNMVLKEDFERHKKFIRKMLDGDITHYQMEKRFFHNDGHTVWTLLSSSAVKNLRGEVQYFIGQVIDITEQKIMGKKLEKSEKRFSKAFRMAPNAILISRLSDGYIYDANNSFFKLIQLEPDEVIGHKSTELSLFEKPEDREELLHLLKQNDQIRDYEMQLKIQSGETRQVLVSIEEIDLEGEECLLTMMNDFTEQKKYIDALTENEARIRTILETTVDAIITVDASGKIKSFNKAAQEMFGYAEEEVLNQNVKILTPSPYRENYDTYLENYRHTGEKRVIGYQRELYGQRKDGSTFPLDLSVSEVVLKGRRIFTGIIRDITERRRLEKELLHVSEQERRRIGQDLHDGLGQMLTGITLISQGLARKLKANASPGSEEVQEIADLIKEADQYARKLARGLMPAELETNGLSAALNQLASNAERLFGIKCYYKETCEISIQDKSVALHLYRIAQEAVSNAVKHGKADKVTISLTYDNYFLTLQVKDNGMGFSQSKKKDRGMGVQIMHYRSKIINGDLEIRSVEKETEVICKLSQETLNLIS